MFCFDYLFLCPWLFAIISSIFTDQPNRKLASFSKGFEIEKQTIACDLEVLGLSSLKEKVYMLYVIWRGVLLDSNWIGLNHIYNHIEHVGYAGAHMVAMANENVFRFSDAVLWYCS